MKAEEFRLAMMDVLEKFDLRVGVASGDGAIYLYGAADQPMLSVSTSISRRDLVAALTYGSAQFERGRKIGVFEIKAAIRSLIGAADGARSVL